MMTIFTFVKTASRLLVFPLGLLLCQTLSAVTFSEAPTAVSNLYTGVITLQIAGLNSGETVVIQKFLDVNTNGLVGAGDSLMQQFRLTDGQGPSVISGVTNINIPWDSNPAAGAITAQLNLLLGGVEQAFIGQYALVLSSPTSRFPSITNLFNVTNSLFAQSFSGQVLCSGTNVPNAVVMLGLPKGGGPNIVAGTVANNAGGFTIKTVPGSYSLMAFKSGFVFPLGSAIVTLGSGASVITNLTLIPAVQTISGRFVDAANASLGLPGVLIGAGTTNNIWGFSTSDTNGNFIVPANSGQWKVGEDQSPLEFLGYVGLNNNTNYVDTSTGNVTGLTISLPKATALIYGSVKDNNNQPLPGVKIIGDNGNNGSGVYQSGGVTDQNGNYVAGVVAGNWDASISSRENSGLYSNYIFSQGPSWSYNNGGNGTNLSAGMVVQENFTAIRATNQISGYLKDNTNHAIAGVQINANATIGSASYNTQATTDASGNYAFNVANGNWDVNVNCCSDCGSSGSLPSIYQCPGNQSTNILNNNAVVNFIVVPASSSSYQINGSVVDNTFSPVAGVNVYANGNYNVSTTTDAGGNFSLNNVNNGNWDVSVDCAGLNSKGYACVSNQVVNVFNANYDNLSFDVQPCDLLQINTPSPLPSGQVGSVYNLQLQASGCQVPFTWSLAGGALAPGLVLATNGVIAGTPTTNGAFNFTAHVVDAGSHSTNQPFSLTISNVPLQVTSGTLPNATQNVFYSTSLAATGGQPPYHWSLSPGSANLPQYLSLATNGVISGTPVSSGTFNFIVRASDATTTSPGQLVALTVNASANKPLVVLTAPTRLANGQFQFTFNSAAGVNYTLQYATALTNWISIVTLQGSGGPLTVVDPGAPGNARRFYRVKIGP